MSIAASWDGLASFHVSIFLRRRPSLQFAFMGRAWQYRVLTFGLSLSPPCLYEGRGGCPYPIIGSGHHDPQLPRAWPARENSCVITRTWCSSTSPSWGFGSTGKRTSTPPCRESGNHQRAHPVSAELPEFPQRQDSGTTETLSEAPGHMAAAVEPLGLLHMRPLQHWLHFRVPRWAWRHSTVPVTIKPTCCRSFSPWADFAFLRAGVPLEQVSWHVVVTTDASSVG